jgi:hypothetical protein
MSRAEKIKIVLRSSDKTVESLVLETIRKAIEEFRDRVAEVVQIPEKPDLDFWQKITLREREYARGIGFYWKETEYHVAVLSDGRHLHLKGIEGRTYSEAKVEFEAYATSKIRTCPFA